MSTAAAADWNVIREAAIGRIDSSAKELNMISHEIWSNPELAFKENHAHKILTDYLEKEGFKVEKGFVVETGFRATYGSDGGINVCVICEYDALPEIGHACGHNLIAECGIGAGIAIKAGLEMLGGKAGKVTVLGTPAEEEDGAKIPMLDAGIFSNIDVAMMAHGSPYFMSKSRHSALQPSLLWDSKRGGRRWEECHNQSQSLSRNRCSPDSLQKSFFYSLPKVTVLSWGVQQEGGGKNVMINAKAFEESIRRCSDKTLYLKKVTVMGTPAEEGGGGKNVMIDDKAFEGMDVAMMAHGCPSFIPNPRFLAVQQVVITFTGKSAHAAAFPWEGRNALDAAVMCYQNISVMRQQMKPDWRVHGIFTNGGVKPNIIPEKAELYYYLRAPSNVELQDLIERVIGCIEGAARATRCEAKHEFKVSYLDVVTNKGLISLYEKHAQELGVKFEADPNISDKALGSTDMGNVSYVVPSIHPMFDINTVAPNHSREFTADAGAPTAQEPTLTQAKALALTGLELLMPGNGHLLQNIRKEFDATFGNSK